MLNYQRVISGYLKPASPFSSSLFWHHQMVNPPSSCWWLHEKTTADHSRWSHDYHRNMIPLPIGFILFISELMILSLLDVYVYIYNYIYILQICIYIPYIYTHTYPIQSLFSVKMCNISVLEVVKPAVTLEKNVQVVRRFESIEIPDLRWWNRVKSGYALVTLVNRLQFANWKITTFHNSTIFYGHVPVRYFDITRG